MSLVENFRQWQARYGPGARRDFSWEPASRRPAPAAHPTECRCGTPLEAGKTVQDRYCSDDCVPGGGITYDLTGNRWNWRPTDVSPEDHALRTILSWSYNGLTASVLADPVPSANPGAVIRAQLRLDDGHRYVGKDWYVPPALLADAAAVQDQAAPHLPTLLRELTDEALLLPAPVPSQDALAPEDRAWITDRLRQMLTEEVSMPGLEALREVLAGRRSIRTYLRKITRGLTQAHIMLFDVESAELFLLASARLPDDSLPGASPLRTNAEIIQALPTLRIDLHVDHDLYDFAEEVIFADHDSGFYSDMTLDALRSQSLPSRRPRP